MPAGSASMASVLATSTSPAASAATSFARGRRTTSSASPWASATACAISTSKPRTTPSLL